MAKKMEGLEQLLVEELQDLFDAEKQLVRALPKMAKSAADQELENELEHYKRQVGLYARSIELATGQPAGGILMRV